MLGGGTPTDWRRYAAALICAVALLGGRSARAELDPEIVDLLDAEPAPSVSLDPQRRYLLLVHQRRLIARERLAEPTLELAGRRVNVRTGAMHSPIEYYALSLVDLAQRQRIEIALPRNARIGFPAWAPDGSRFALVLHGGAGPELWIGEPAEGRLRPLTRPINNARGHSCDWTPDSRHLLCRQGLADATFGSDSIVNELSDNSTFALTLSTVSPTDKGLAARYLESRLEMIDVISGQRHQIGVAAAIEDVDSAPAGAYLLIRRIEKPYPANRVDPVRYEREVWDRFGRVVAHLPAAARAPGWHATQPATLVWVERREGKDRVLSLAAPFNGPPKVEMELPNAFGGLRWLGDSSAAIVTDYAAETRRATLLKFDFDEDSPPMELASYQSGSPLIPLMGVNRRGQQAIVVADGSVYFRGAGRQPFIDAVDLSTGSTTRRWQADDDVHEQLLDILSADASRLLVSREDADQPPNIFVRESDESLWALTQVTHPTPTLAAATRMRVEYERADGLALSATLHLPAEADPDVQLPMVLWAYPHRVISGGDARLGSDLDRYPTFDRAFRQFFLLRGYAVLDDVSMPIVGSDSDANDTFIEQVVANAAAAVEAAVATGFIDEDRIGVAGHSYGAFMAANLLAHSNLFRAGVALSGAYNRTLTPFGFQTERRTFWDAPDTYLAMSPFIFANQIDAPLLLVHGLQDDNAGTAPIQSMQFFEAIRGTGGQAELLLLPFEGHEYRARESVLDTAATMLSWFDRHLHADFVAAELKETGAFLRP